MANILYGVNGEGAGHSTRAKEVISHLKAKGHDVRVVSFDRGYTNLSKSFDVTEIYRFRMAYVNNRVRYKRTFAKNLITAPHAAKSAGCLMKLAAARGTQLMGTEFEPLSCDVGPGNRLPGMATDIQ